MSKKMLAEIRKHSKVLKQLRSSLAKNLKSQSMIQAHLTAKKKQLKNKNVKKARNAYRSIHRLTKKLKIMQHKINQVNGSIFKAKKMGKNVKKIFKIAKSMPSKFQRGFSGKNSFGKCLQKGGGACHGILKDQMKLIRREKKCIRGIKKFVKRIKLKLKKKKSLLKNLKVHGHFLKKEDMMKLDKTIKRLSKRFSAKKKFIKHKMLLIQRSKKRITKTKTIVKFFKRVGKYKKLHIKNLVSAKNRYKIKKLAIVFTSKVTKFKIKIQKLQRDANSRDRKIASKATLKIYLLKRKIKHIIRKVVLLKHPNRKVREAKATMKTLYRNTNKNKRNVIKLKINIIRANKLIYKASKKIKKLESKEKLTRKEKSRIAKRKSYLHKIRKSYWRKKTLLKKAKKSARKGKQLLLKKIKILKFAHKLEKILPKKMSKIKRDIKRRHSSKKMKVRKIKKQLKKYPDVVVKHAMKAIQRIHEIIIRKQVMIVEIRVVITIIIVEIRKIVIVMQELHTSSQSSQHHID